MHQITYLTPEQRAEYRIEIHNGLFHKEGTLFDSSELIAHKKPGFAAFTLNTNGEFSVFKHLEGQPDKDRRLAHSSMNSGGQVLSAGEMEIRNGKLISINTYSGHYNPSVYSIARFLEYLSDRGVDISETKVYLQNYEAMPRIKKVSLPGDPYPWYEVQATDIVHSVKAIMNSNLNSLEDYLKSRKTILLRDVLRNDLTRAKSAIAQDFHDELSYAMDQVKDSSSLLELKQSIDFLDTILTRYSLRLEALNGKKGRLDSKFTSMRNQISKAQAELGRLDEKTENDRIERFKKLF